jgi:hypothetical protein
MSLDGEAKLLTKLRREDCSEYRQAPGSRNQISDNSARPEGYRRRSEYGNPEA